jgi:RNA polymerase sigma-70 factor (ECF subfamily)
MKATAALARGDHQEALVTLMQEYGEAIYRYCYNVLRNRSMTDDLHQIVFVQAFQDLKRFSGSASFRPWLYTIAHNRCLDALKLHRRWLARFTFWEAIPEQQDPSPSSEERLSTRSRAAALDDCLARLPPHIRTAVLLRYQESFSYEEMAHICHERPATLQARVARAMPTLRQCLKAKQWDYGT